MKHFILLLLVALAASATTPAYICSVANCETCSYLGVCGLCQDQFMLMINQTSGQTYCGAVTCDVSNCMTCYKNDMCEMCENGFSLTVDGTCTSSPASTAISCSDNCLACNSTTWCNICQFGYNSAGGICYPNNGYDVENCQSTFTGYACQLCDTNYITNIAYQCVAAPGFTCTVENCEVCESDGVCSTCESGFNAVSGQCQEIECDIEYCSQCSDNSTCTSCSTGYLILNNTCIWKSMGCNVENCVACSYQAEQCISCSPGYQVMSYQSEDQTFLGTACMQITSSLPATSPAVTNCQTYGPMIFGTSALTLGCLACNDNYINVGGYCLANLTQSNYACNIENCVYCIQNNVCGQCAEGYTAYMGSTFFCLKNYSPLANCALTPLFSPVCQECMSGYVLSEYQCVMVNAEISCQVAGCDYCLEDGECSQCRNGYEANSENECIALCQNENCYTCSDNSTCEICNYGYILNEGECVDASAQTADCPETVSNCQTCNSLSQCTACNDDYTLYNGACCATPTQDIAYCAQYAGVCSTECIQCEAGTFHLGIVGATHCVKFPCTLSNCAYCYNSETCLVCSEGYTLQSGQCTEYTPCDLTNCASCNEDGTCATCVNDYFNYNGSCVCPFQNCLECQGAEFCTVCAFPTVPTILNEPGCLPEIVPFTLCNVANCLNCQYVNMCASCSAGFSLLSNGTCQQNTCDLSTNCELCSVSGDICFLPQQGYIQENIFSRNCVAVSLEYSCEVYGCAVCESSTVCETCIPFFNLNRGECDPITCIDNCAICYETNGCTICDFTFYLSDNNTCLPVNSTIPDSCKDIDSQCISCVTNSAGTAVCNECYLGMNPASDGLSCVPNDCSIDHCHLCMETKGMEICLACEQSYFMTSYFQCASYSPAIDTVDCSSIYNCLYCSSEEYCAFCTINWNNTNGVCLTNEYCDVANCESCSSSDTCVTCNEDYSTDSLGSCIPVCGVTYCGLCESTTQCGACNTNFNLENNKTDCICPEPFSLVNSTCACTEGTTYYFNETSEEGECVSCDVEYCTQCNDNNTCNDCTSNLLVNETDGTCICQDTYEINATSETCVCPTDCLPNPEDDNNCVLCTTDYCEYCTSNDTCGACLTNFQLDANNTCNCPEGSNIYEDNCYTCDVENCDTCSNNGYCGTCTSPFVSSMGSCVCPEDTTLSNNTCVSCSISYCSMCTEADVCDSCLSTVTYTLLNNACIPCNVANCSACSSPNYCSTCSEGLAVSSTGSQCVQCNIDDCVACSGNNVCASCESGYQLTSTARSCITCNVAGCSSCSSNNVCSTCNTGYTLNSNACSVCQYPCLTCDSTGGCLTCQAPYSSSAATNGTCYTCNVANCATCPSTDTSSCTTCATNYAASGTTCVSSSACDINCADCTLNQTCSSCVGGYTINPSNTTQCLACNVNNCLTCSPTDLTTCKQCYSGYYLQNGVCNSCPYSNCKTCTSTSCLTFKSNQIALNINNVIVPATCDLNCITCSTNNPNFCLSCMPGYARNSLGFCVTCSSTCKTCSATSATTCTSCYANAVLSGNTCTTCNSNCLTCSSTSLSTCTSCITGYSISSSNTCVKNCPFNCLTCSSSTVCTTCKTGYSVSYTGVCLPCTSSCRQCAGNAQGTCLGCGTGFFLTSTGTCSSCPTFCSTCSSTSTCLTCMSGYSLNSSLQCTQDCTWPCATCLSTNAASCTSCLAGYTLGEGTNICNAQTTCDNGICYVCPLGSSLNENTCVTCTTSNCARCEPTTPATCYSCKSGYYLDTALTTPSCTACPTGCLTCSSSSNCLTCTSGYTVLESTVSGIQGQCTICQSPCATCTGNGLTCTSCVSGSTLKGWKCVTNFNYIFTIKLNVGFTAFYDNYYNFLQAIVEPLGTTDVSPMTISDIVSGSVEVSGTVSTSAESNSNTAGNQYYGIDNVLGQQSISGMPVLAYTLDSEGGQIPDSSSSTNTLAIILGICIPVGIIIIGVIIYFMCIRNKNNTPPVVYESNDGQTTVRQTFELTRDEPTI